MKSVAVKAAVAVSLSLLASHGYAAPGDIYSLGTLGGSQSQGDSINSSGQVVGTAADKNQQIDGFIYTPPGPGGTMTAIASGGASTASGINDSGWVTGNAIVTTVPKTLYHAYLYHSSSPSAFDDLGALDSGLQSFGEAINNSNQVAGYSETSSSSSNVHAFLYTGTPGSGGAMMDLGTLGGTQSWGYGINASGQVVGQAAVTGDTVNHAFLYTGIPGSGGAMADLGALGGSSEVSGAYAINDSGEITGYSGTGAPLNSEHAFLYTGTPGNGGAMADLGSLGGLSFGYGINSKGDVVGYSDLTANTNPHAFIYTGTPGVDGQMIDLNTWLLSVDPTAASQWTLTEALGINNSGLITGVGTYQGTTRAFVLDASSLVPEPTGLALIFVACGAMSRRRMAR